MDAEEHIYEIVAREVAAKQLRPGLWAKAFSQAVGDHDKAVAIYIELRKEQIKAELLDEIEQRRQKQRNTERQRRIAQYFDFTYCTKCHAHLRISKAMVGVPFKCPKCQHPVKLRR